VAEELKFTLEDLDRILRWGLTAKEAGKFALDDGVLLYRIGAFYDEKVLIKEKAEKP